MRCGQRHASLQPCWHLFSAPEPACADPSWWMKCLRGGLEGGVTQRPPLDKTTAHVAGSHCTFTPAMSEKDSCVVSC